MSILDSFANVKVLVVGDVMLDRYWWGSVKRISPEAPVPVVNLTASTYAPGGAANVAANIAGLGAKPYLVGCVGEDGEAERLAELLTDVGVSPDFLVRSNDRPTTTKTRVIAHSQQVVRVDQESSAVLSADVHDAVSNQLAAALPGVDAVVISDYAKGLLSPGMLSALIDDARSLHKPVLVDPKGKDYARYRGADLITPNLREAAEACNLAEETPDLVKIAGTRLLDELDLGMVLITQGEEGMTLFQKAAEPIHLGASAHEVYDVTGAGDTVIACLGVGFGARLDFATSARVANIAAGLVVQQLGTTAITRKLLAPELVKL